MTYDLDNFEEFVKHMRARTHAELPRTLEGTVLLPARDALFAEKFSAVITLHRVLEDL